MLRGGDLTLLYTLLYVHTIQRQRQQIKLFCTHTTGKKFRLSEGISDLTYNTLKHPVTFTSALIQCTV